MRGLLQKVSGPRSRSWLVLGSGVVALVGLLMNSRSSGPLMVLAQGTDERPAAVPDAVDRALDDVTMPTPPSTTEIELPSLPVTTPTVPVPWLTVPEVPTSTLPSTTVPPTTFITSDYDSLDATAYVSYSGDIGDNVTLYVTGPDGRTASANLPLSGSGGFVVGLRMHGPCLGRYVIGLRFEVKENYPRQVDASVNVGRTNRDQTHDDGWWFMHDFFPDYSSIPPGVTVVETTFDFPP